MLGKFKLSVVLFVLSASLLGCGGEDPNSPVAKRKHVFKSMLSAKEVLYKMSSKQKPLDPRLAKEQAELLVSLADQPWPYFAADFQSAGNGEAKDSVWTNRPLFQTKIDAFKSAVIELKQATASGGVDFNTFHQAYRKVENTCADCHRQFRDF